jgi:hypothetical protein
MFLEDVAMLSRNLRRRRAFRRDKIRGSFDI